MTFDPMRQRCLDPNGFWNVFKIYKTLKMKLDPTKSDSIATFRRNSYNIFRVDIIQKVLCLTT